MAKVVRYVKLNMRRTSGQRLVESLSIGYDTKAVDGQASKKSPQFITRDPSDVPRRRGNSGYRKRRESLSESKRF